MLLPAAPGCGQDEPCGSLARLCADDGQMVGIGMRVEDAVILDLDGDGEDEVVALSRSRRQLALAHADGWRSLVFLPEWATGLAGLPGEVAVALAEPPTLAIFDVDGSGRLSRQRDIALRAPPMALRSADLAGDGEPELIAALPEAGQVAVIDPRSGSVREYAAGTYPYELDVGDVDGDGHLDVVAVDGDLRGVLTLDAATGALQVLRGAGDGTLRAARASRADAAMFSLDLADHDGDGDLDALTRDPQTSVMVHRNNGAGEFSTPTALPFRGGDIQSSGLAGGPVVPGGLAGVSVAQGQVLGTWFGKGAAWLGHVETALRGVATWVGATEDGLLVGGHGFLSRFTYERAATPIEVWRDSEVSSGYGSAGLASGDVDGDHLLDFAVAAREDLQVFRGRADLGFDRVATLDLAAPASVLAIADVTGDGRGDVLVDEETRVRVAIATEDGGFAWAGSVEPSVPPRALVPLRTGAGQPAAVAVVGASWFALAEAPGLALLRFSAEGAAEETVLAGSLFVEHVVAVDFDEDGVDEPLILATRDDAAVLTRLKPNGAGYEPGPEHDLTAMSGVTFAEDYWRRLAVGDLDGDGAPEALVQYAEDCLRVSGLVDDAPVVNLVDAGAPTHLRDVDRDGLVDAAYLSGDWFRYRRGRGDGTFEDESTYYWFPYIGTLAFAVRDAQFDLLQASITAVSAHLVREVARPVQAGADNFGFHGDAVKLIVADVDLDGCDDVVTTGIPGGIAWLWGGETEPLARADAADAVSGWATFGDLDGDGAIETIAADASGQVFRVGPWPEVKPLELAVPSGYFARLAIADVDADGRADILALVHVASGGLELHVARGTGPEQFGAWTRAAALADAQIRELGVGDVDDDGDLDVLIHTWDESAILVRALGPGVWAEPEAPETSGLFSRPDARGRVDLVTHDGATIYRHTRGQPDVRAPLVTDESLAASALIQAADADGDGRYDLVVVDEEQTHVWLRGDDGPRQVRLADEPLSAVEFGDIDCDGRPDLVGIGAQGLFVRRTRR